MAMEFSIVAILFASLFAGSLSKPAGLILGYQDTLGQYSFGYSAPHQARSEVRSLNGVTRGAYSYVDAAGLIQSVEYTADDQNGFRVAATNLPQAPVAVQDTPEVVAARTAHLLAVEEASKAVDIPQDDKPETISLKSSAETDEITVENEETSPSSTTSGPIIEAVAETGPEEEEEEESVASIQPIAEVPQSKQDPEEKMEVIEKQEQQQEQKGRAIEDSVNPQVPWIAPAPGSLSVPLIPVNFDLPTITAYSGPRPANAKAEKILPQSTNVQGVITPAGTTLKSVQGAQLVAITPPISVRAASTEPAAPAAATARELAYWPAAHPVNVIPSYVYDPNNPSFYRYAPFPYITYNVL